MAPATGNAADAKSVEKAGKIERRSRMQELNDLSKFVLNTAAGRRYFWKLIEFCGTNTLSYTRGDTHEGAFREGMRNVGNKILADIMDCNAEIYLTMRSENIEEELDARDGDSVDGKG